MEAQLHPCAVLIPRPRAVPMGLVELLQQLALAPPENFGRPRGWLANFFFLRAPGVNFVVFLMAAKRPPPTIWEGPLEKLHGHMTSFVPKGDVWRRVALLERPPGFIHRHPPNQRIFPRLKL